MSKDLWKSNSLKEWQEALESYPAVIKRQTSERLPEHDLWYREQLPEAIASRERAHITHDELVRLTEWKMTRGVWRARNLALVKGNEPELVKKTSTAAIMAAPHPTSPIAALSKLAGVGPATASAVMAATYPGTYPFFDELVAAQIPELEAVAFTLGYYARYAEALRKRALELGKDWTPAATEQALWAHSGGKAGVA